MKVKVGLLIVICVMLCCGKYEMKAENIEKKMPGQYVKSKVQKSSCCICGENERSLMSIYRGLDSVGIVCLNHMQICNTNVSMFDSSGEEALSNSGSSISIVSMGGDDCKFWISEIPQYGIVKIQVSYGEKSTPDFEKIQEWLCDDCLNKVKEMYHDEMKWGEGYFPDVCLIDFETNELYSLGSKCDGYFIRDYYVRIDYNEEQHGAEIFISNIPGFSDEYIDRQSV